MSFVDVCDPILTIEQLLNGSRDAFRWCEMVEPLVERSAPRFMYNKYYSMDYNLFEVEGSHPEVLVCHDYKGNYLDDKFINGTPRWEEYRFYNWSLIDYFCYFSHKLVTVPTLQFLNAAHKNGVKVLGTLIVEDVDGQKALYDDILSSREQVERVSESLVEISKRLKFEGWLLNVEVNVDFDKVEMLKYFVEYLTKLTNKEISNGRVIWYDSVTNDGKLAWQNELNVRNETFFNSCDGIFTNYNWSILHLERSSKLVDLKFPERRNNVFFGIDVFGRGQIAGFRSNEVTVLIGFSFIIDISILPQTLSKIAAFKFSSAIFAPGWTCETIDSKIGFDGLEPNSEEFRERFNQKFLERNDRFWSSLCQYLHMFGPKSLPFVTNFCIGSGKNFYRMGRDVKKCWFNLKYQSIQPSTPSREGFFTHFYDDAFDGGSSLSLDSTELIRLFVCDLACDEDLIFSYTFKRNSDANDVQMVLNFQNVQTNVDTQLVFEGSNGTNPFAISCLNTENVRDVAVFLANNRQTFVPSQINGWETRYFFFSRSTKVRVTDIGVRKLRHGKVLLGFMAFYSAKGLNRQNFSHINTFQL